MKILNWNVSDFNFLSIFFHFSEHANLSQQFVLMNNFPFFTYLSYIFFFNFFIFVIFHLLGGVFMTKTESQTENAWIIHSFLSYVFLSFSLIWKCFPSRELFFYHIFAGNYYCHLSYYSKAEQVQKFTILPAIS